MPTIEQRIAELKKKFGDLSPDTDEYYMYINTKMRFFEPWLTTQFQEIEAQAHQAGYRKGLERAKEIIAAIELTDKDVVDAWDQADRETNKS